MRGTYIIEIGIVLCFYDCFYTKLGKKNYVENNQSGLKINRARCTNGIPIISINIIIINVICIVCAYE